MLEFFLPAFVTFFVVVDPLGTAMVFLAFTRNHTEEQAKAIARKSSAIATVLMLAFGIGGIYLLQALGLSPNAFRIAGGILLFVTAFRMVMGQSHQTSPSADPNRPLDDIAVFPLAIPFLCGPGCMTAAILHMTKAPDIAAMLAVIAAMLAVQLIAFLCNANTKKLYKVLGHTGANILARVMGVLLAALAIQFMADGILGFIQA